MTLKQEQVIKQLPHNNFNLSKTMRQVGYSDSTSKSGEQYRILRNHTSKYFDEESVKRDLKRVMREARKAKDFTAQLRSLESQARIMSMYKDNTSLKADISNSNDKDVLLRYGLIDGKGKSDTQAT